MIDRKILGKCNHLKILERARHGTGRDIPVCDGQVWNEGSGVFLGERGARLGKTCEKGIAHPAPPFVRDYPGKYRSFRKRAETFRPGDEGRKAFRNSIERILHHAEHLFVVHSEGRYQGYVKGRREPGSAAELLTHPVPASFEGFRERLGRKDADKMSLIRQAG